MKFVIYNLECDCTDTNIHIKDSYKIKDIDVFSFLKYLKDVKLKENFTYKRSLRSMEIEWIAHNILYRKGLFISNTKDVDINENETILRKLGYYIIYYLHEINIVRNLIFK